MLRRLLLVAALVLVMSAGAARAVNAQTPPAATQTAGIPGSTTVPAGGSVVFSQGTRSLTVVSRTVLGPVLRLAATITYDGADLTIEIAQERFAEVNVQPPDDRTCMYVNGRANAVRCAVLAAPGRAPIVFDTVAGFPTFPCPDVALTAGWNLIAGALAHNINTNIGALYTLQAGDSNYSSLTDVQDAVDTAGYWVRFDQPTAVFDFDLSRFGGCGPPRLQPAGPVTLALPAGQWVLIGNPFSAATASGADVVLTYDPMNGYMASNHLSLGQSAWAYSAAGAEATLTPVQ